MYAMNKPPYQIFSIMQNATRRHSMTGIVPDIVIAMVVRER